MKKFIFVLTAAVILMSSGNAGALTTEEQLNSLWLQKKHSEIESLLDVKLAQTPPDPVAAYCAKFFYVVVKADKTKALSAVTKLKQIADGTGNPGFVDLANHALNEVQGIPANSLSIPQPQQLDKIHEIFPNRFPNIELAVRLRQYVTP